jgi:hypothetical protein
VKLLVELALSGKLEDEEDSLLVVEVAVEAEDVGVAVRSRRGSVSSKGKEGRREREEVG